MPTISPATQAATVATGSGLIGFLSSFAITSPSEVALITALVAAILTAFVNYETAAHPAPTPAPAAAPVAKTA